MPKITLDERELNFEEEDDVSINCTIQERIKDAEFIVASGWEKRENAEKQIKRGYWYKLISILFLLFPVFPVFGKIIWVLSIGMAGLLSAGEIWGWSSRACTISIWKHLLTRLNSLNKLKAQNRSFPKERI